MGSTNVTIGYKYFLGLQFCLCQDEMTELHAIYTNNTEKIILDPGNYLDGSDPYVDKPSLYGGRKKGGGVVGQLRLQFGKPDQQPLAYLNNVVSVDPALPADIGVVPLRGLSTVVAEQAYICSMNPSMRPWEFRGYRRPKLTYANNAQTDVEIAPYGLVPADDGYDANPIAALEECFFNTEWGLGLSQSEVDVVSLQTAMSQLKSEGVGVSMRFSDSKGMKAFIREILTHINGVLFLSPSTGKLTLRLLREGDPVELAVTKDNMLEMLSFERTSWSSTINELTVEYTDKTNYDKASLALHSSSNLDTQGDIVPRTVNYPGFRSQALAARAGARDLSLLSYPLARLELAVNKEAWNLTAGSVITVDYPEYNFSGTRFRVLNIDYGELADEKIKLLVIEDVVKDYSSYTSVYGFSASQISSSWESITTGQATPADIFSAVAMPYYSLYNVQSTADFNVYDLSLDTFYVFAKKPSQDTNGFRLDNNAGETSNLLASTWVVSVEGVRIGDVRTGDQFVLAVYPEGVNRLSNENLSELTNSATAALFMDDEIFIIDSAAARTDGGYDLTLRRGAFDTVPAYHVAAAGVKTYGFVMRSVNDVSRSYGGLNNVAIADGDVANYHLLTETFSDLTDYASSPAISLTGVSRAARPSPVRNVRVTYSSTATQINWAFDDKTVSTGTPPREGAYSGTPESTDVLVKVVVKAHDGSAILSTIVDSTTTSVSIDKAVEQAATTDGLLSPSAYVEITCLYNSDPTNVTYQAVKVLSFRPYSFLSSWANHISQVGNATEYNHVDYTLAKQYRYVCDDGSVVFVTGSGNDATIYVCDENGTVSNTYSGGNLVGLLAGGTPDWIDVTGATSASAKVAWTTDGTNINVADVSTVTTTITNTFTVSDASFNSVSKLLIDASYLYVSDKTQVYATVASVIEQGVSTGTSDLHGVIHILSHDGVTQSSVTSPLPPSGDRTIVPNEQYAVDMFKTGEAGKISVTWVVPYAGATGQDYTLTQKADIIDGATASRTELSLGVSGIANGICEYAVGGPNGFAVEVWDGTNSSSYICYVPHASTVASWQYLWNNQNSTLQVPASLPGVATARYPISVGASNLYVTASNDFPDSVVNQGHRPQYVVPGLYSGPADSRGDLLMSGYSNYSDYSQVDFDGLHYTGSLFKLSLSTGAVVTSGWSHDNPFFVKAANEDASDPTIGDALGYDKIERVAGVNSAETKVLVCTKYTGRLYWINIQ